MRIGAVILMLLAVAAAAPVALAAPPAPPAGGYMWEPGGGSQAGTAWYNQPIRDYREPAPPRARASLYLRSAYHARAYGAWGFPRPCSVLFRRAGWGSAFSGPDWRRPGPRCRRAAGA
jgi:hypothetical protein